ncbi:MAG: hypothetical protein Q4P24_15190, partial [Rhodobacterales bacterium]|nr:hypothetical protein [Rhodobacterales bacterium]
SAKAARARASGSGMSTIRQSSESRTGCAGSIASARERNCRPASRSLGFRFSRWRIALAPGARTQCPNHSAPPLMAVRARCLRGDAVLCSDRAFHIQTIDSLHDRFERFMEPFRGPATRNLTGYASWFIARSVRTEPERVEDAWDRLMAA